MSAYIVDPETVNRVVWFLESISISNPYSGLSVERIREEIAKSLGVVGYGDAFFHQLAHEMMALNVEAVKWRYPDLADDNLPGPIDFRLDEYRYRPASWRRSLVQVYKSLQCWLYQCSEGDVLERPLFKTMSKLGAAIAEEIVCSLPEYDEAIWA